MVYRGRGDLSRSRQEGRRPEPHRGDGRRAGGGGRRPHRGGGGKRYRGKNPELRAERVRLDGPCPLYFVDGRFVRRDGSVSEKVYRWYIPRKMVEMGRIPKRGWHVGVALDPEKSRHGRSEGHIIVEYVEKVDDMTLERFQKVLDVAPQVMPREPIIRSYGPWVRKPVPKLGPEPVRAF